MDKKKILLIGLGFIGTNFYKLFKDQYKIVLMDNGDYPCTIMNGFWDLDVPDLYNKDLCSTIESLKELIDEIKPDYIVNMAAKSHVDRSINENDTFITTNTIGVENILKCIKGTNIRLVHFSTDEVYGDTDINDLYEFKETDKLNPSSPYSASKAAADMIINAYHRTYGVNVVTVRPTNNYGPYQYPEKLIPFIIKRISENKTIPIYGNGANIREWLYTDDCCVGVELVMRKGDIGEVYNIGGGFDNRTSNVFIASQLQGSNNNFEYIEDRKGHDRRYAVDSSKIRNLGWSNKIDIKEGLQLTKDWYMKRLDIIKSLEANPHIK